ncbi:hypothetical protein Trydic_g12842 [Trypoxylus dichotomus]
MALIYSLRDKVLEAVRLSGHTSCLWSLLIYVRIIFLVCFTFKTEGKNETLASGVPQGSVRRPILWNVAYDTLLRLKQLEGVKLIEFADEVMVVAIAKTG